MVHFFHAIVEIDQILAKELDKTIDDFKIFVRLNIELDIYIKSSENELIDKLLNEYTKMFRINILVYSQNEVVNDPFLESIFSRNTQRVNYGLKFRFQSLLKREEAAIKDTSLPPIITFYSYKGGMGRTTTMSAFASYASIHRKKKVLMIDCDLEAPGFNNFFDLSTERLEGKSGFVEYLIDSQSQKSTPDLEKYILEIDKEFSGEGTILVMPAGNLSTNQVNESSDSQTHLQHYLEALARVDIANEAIFSANFRNLLNEINLKYRPDLVLIDSRTGFSDIFGITAFGLSDMAVGFFGSSEQTVPGLYYFLDATLRIQKKFDVVLVNSILPMGDRRGFKNFLKLIDDITAEKIHDLEQVPSFQSFPVTRFPLLENIGIDSESRQSFIQIVLDKEFGDYNQLFEGLLAKINQPDEISTVEAEAVEASNIAVPVKTKRVEKSNLNKNLTPQPSNWPYSQPPNYINGLKKSLLEILDKDYPESYADDINFNEDFMTKKFYFRPKIYNVFNADKFLIMGGKGTGKTLLYQGLRNEFFISGLKEKAEKNNESYISTGAINLQKDVAKDRYFIIHSHIDIDKIVNYEIYFQKFWLVYVWNILMIDIRKGRYLSDSEFFANLVPDITDDTSTKVRLLNIIEDEEQIIKIENDLLKIDELLKLKQLHLFVLFDQLDFVCKPIYWDRVISPFVNFWRSNRFTRILPKIFIRADLFNKLGNITNKQQLKNQAIDLEWSQEEIYAFFFKWILSSVNSQFYNLMSLYQEINPNLIDEIKNVTIKNHVPTDSKYLEPLVFTFFGKYADANGTSKFGTCYEWFYSNLKNADGTISLRPFIDLIWFAIKRAVFDNKSDKERVISIKPILPPKYFIASEVRKSAVMGYFKDLSQEEGNRDLEIVANHISKMAPNHSLKKLYLKKRDFDALISGVIEANSDIEHRDVDSLKKLLVVNGIVAEIPVSGAYLNYRFAFLYKYFFGLK
jgi:MinD-like ATPase involved in chromosome partitioning or flagellar assembly